jgi:acyl-CoA synthetase (NDP forming)
MPRNPVDIAGDFRSPLIFAELAETMAKLDYIGVLLITPPSSRGNSVPILAEEAAERIARIPTDYGKPVIALGQIHASNGGDSSVSRILRSARIPGYQRPEDAARAAYSLIRYSQVRSISQSIGLSK